MSDARSDHGSSMETAVLQQQRLAGNRAVAAAAGLQLQRHPAATTNDEAETATIEPGTGTGTGTGTAPAGRSRKEQVESKLRTTATGLWVLDILTKWKIPVDYEFTGQGSFHRTGKIFVNKALSVDAAAIVMMHEAQHANTYKSGAAADVMALTRQEFIKRKIADEAESVVRQIEGSVPLLAAGANLAGSGITKGLIDRYRAAFYKKRDELEASDPSMTRAEINRRCRIAARDGEVTNWFYDGTFVTSTGNITYSAHYGKTWDDNHKPPKAPAAGKGVGK